MVVNMIIVCIISMNHSFKTLTTWETRYMSIPIVVSTAIIHSCKTLGIFQVEELLDLVLHLQAAFFLLAHFHILN